MGRLCVTRSVSATWHMQALRALRCACGSAARLGSRSTSALTTGLGTLLCALVSVVALLGLAAPGSALAYTREWRCKPANNTWCYDPSGKSDWQEGKVKLEKGYNAYICVGVFNEPWGADLCTESRVPAGSALDWKFGTAFSAHDPLHGAGLQDNEYGNAQEIWNWFYEP